VIDLDETDGEDDYSDEYRRDEPNVEAQADTLEESEYEEADEISIDNDTRDLPGTWNQENIIANKYNLRSRETSVAIMEAYLAESPSTFQEAMNTSEALE